MGEGALEGGLTVGGMGNPPISVSIASVSVLVLSTGVMLIPIVAVGSTVELRITMLCEMVW